MHGWLGSKVSPYDGRCRCLLGLLRSFFRKIEVFSEIFAVFAFFPVSRDPFLKRYLDPDFFKNQFLLHISSIYFNF